MSNGTRGDPKSVDVLPGGKTRTSLEASTTNVCQMKRTILSALSSSFVRSTPENKAAFGDLINRLHNPGTHDRLLITGHTDSTGSADANLHLSERRAQNVQAVLKGDVSVWETFFGAGQGGEKWGSPELTIMVVETGEADPSDKTTVDKAVNRYKGATNQAARANLLHRYFKQLLSGNNVPPFQATSPELLACGDKNLLRGDKNNPSKDPTLPSIKGDYEPNRRVEFFFFDKSLASIDCSEYPKWTSVCSLIQPVPTITVTIASIETIGKGKSSDVQVTITPSPLPWGYSILLTLNTTQGTGEARFTSTNSDKITLTKSDTVSVRGIDASNVADNIRMVATVTGQSKVLAQEDFTVTDAVNIFLKFEVWDPTIKTFLPLPAGVDVDIMDYDPISNDRLITRQTDSQGRVLFNIPDLKGSGESLPDIFFLVHSNGRNYAHLTLPIEWSTKGWKSTDGSDGYYEDFTGKPLGTPSNPLIFRIGLDFHIRLEYHIDGGARAGSNDVAPKGVPVSIWAGSTFAGIEDVVGVKKAQLNTDDSGEAHGVIFDIKGGDSIHFHIEFEIEDPTIHLKKTSVHMSQDGWRTFWDDPDKKIFSTNNTSIGKQSSPETLRCTVNDRNVALYFLKIVREWSAFLFLMTGGDWNGIELTLFRTALFGVAYSWPVGEVNIPPSDHWNRETITHELSHQIMWKEVNYSTLGIAYESIFGDYSNYHQENLLANPQHALIEGWAEFMEAIFEGKRSPPFSVSMLRDKSGTPFPLGPPPNDRGESVEGALANGLWAIFEKHVVLSGNAHVPETRNGNIMTTTAATWLNNPAIKDRFISMIFQPLKDLKPLSNPESTNLLNNIKTRNPTVWSKLKPELNAFNMAIQSLAPPVISDIQLPYGPVDGGSKVIIRGANFEPSSEVAIDQKTVTNIKVISSSEIEVITPSGNAGYVDIVVTNPDGQQSRPPGTFEYIIPLKVYSINPSEGPSTSATRIHISGSGFRPEAIVEIGGQKATSFNVVSDTLIEAETPSPLSSGPADVEVSDKIGQRDKLPGGFVYL